MRQVLTISLPTTVRSHVKTLAASRGFRSVSTYIQYLINLDRELISEAELLASVREARREYKTGKTVRAKSLADLV